MTVWIVILVDHGAIDADGVQVFTTEQAAVENFMQVWDDIQMMESDTCKLDMASWCAWSENYSLLILEKEV